MPPHDETEHTHEKESAGQPGTGAGETTVRLAGRAGPWLRAAGAALENSPALREARDSLADRAAAYVKRVDDAVSRLTAIEGDVVESTSHASPHTPRPTASAGSTTAARHGAHWTRDRLTRIAYAAAREAVRPDTPRQPSAGMWPLGAAAMASLTAVAFLAGRRSARRR